MIETLERRLSKTTENLSPVQLLSTQQDAYPAPGRTRLLGQMPRFMLVGGLNTALDLLVLNGLLFLLPTTRTLLIGAYAIIAYSVGAVNSFLLNKYWTFEHERRTTWGEVGRFTITTLFGIGWNTGLIWLASAVAHPFLTNTVIWTNASKVVAIGSAALISYLGMRLWVFVSTSREKDHIPTAHSQTDEAAVNGQHSDAQTYASKQSGSRHGLSVVLPAYNEEQVIADTVSDVLDVLSTWKLDIEVLVVNDGSTDRTRAIVAELAHTHPQVRLITHAVNQGYGAALVSGFAAATKELILFMDADGQFDIRALQQFLPFIDEYDAIIGYRIDRQDSWMRKLNAWGWKLLIGWVLDIHVRDMDCAFKLLHTEFLRQYPLETRGAMINAEMLHRLIQAGYSYREIGVYHRPRRAGRATGAKPSVILRALYELFVYTRTWRRKEQMHAVPTLEPQRQTRKLA